MKTLCRGENLGTKFSKWSKVADDRSGLGIQKSKKWCISIKRYNGMQNMTKHD